MLGIGTIPSSPSTSLDPLTKKAIYRAFEISKEPPPTDGALRDLIADFILRVSAGQDKIDIVVAWKKAAVPPMMAAIVANTLWDLRTGIMPPDPRETPSFGEIIEGYKEDVKELATATSGLFRPSVLWPLAIIATAFVGWKVLK